MRLLESCHRLAYDGRNFPNSIVYVHRYIEILIPPYLSRFHSLNYESRRHAHEFGNAVATENKTGEFTHSFRYTSMRAAHALIVSVCLKHVLSLTRTR